MGGVLSVAVQQDGLLELFYRRAVTNNSRNRPRHLFYPEVNTKGVAKLTYLKGRELKRKGFLWKKTTMMPFTEKTK